MRNPARTLYPKSYDTTRRLGFNDPGRKKTRRAFFMGLGSNFLYLQLLFLGLFCYVFGALFQQNGHIHNLGVVFVDYDGGAIGNAVRGAYASLESDTFITLVERPPSDFQTPADVADAVCKTRFWAGFYVAEGASDRLHDALQPDNAAASLAYDSTRVMSYVWNEALYPTAIDSAVSANIQLLATTARVAYSTGNGTGGVSSVSGPAALSVFANPWQLQSLDIQPTSQGSRAIYNTIVIILILIQEFFYLGTINGLYAQFKLYARIDPYRIIAVRVVASLAYTFIGSLCVIGTIFAFRANWDIDGSQFVLSWIALWLFAHVNFLTLDVFTIWVPPAFVPMVLISWIILNITSTLLPFDLSPAFYRLGYAMPAHEVYQVLIDVWSRGCNPQLHYALPVLFAWEVASLALSTLGVFRRCHFATIGAEREAHEFKERLDAAVAFQLALERKVEKKKSDRARRQGSVATAATGPESIIAVGTADRPVTEGDDEPEEKKQPETEGGQDATSSTTSDEESEVHDELAEIIHRINTRQQRETERAGGAANFGPSFNLPFSHGDGDDDGAQ
ncbi:hypothetical protein B0T24DRAFT_639988 [Lasiosphaeria ovina]|uniref:DUF3533 domain-containing protein n=1 Tax=Lasiosphaeria ovina TaxID=92902 RepID=A0AAE0JVZ6_9PEZI|nr:hypothetical protein B0T24DRAFT_639988 [Lasiosphaeria ovina]